MHSTAGSQTKMQCKNSTQQCDAAAVPAAAYLVHPGLSYFCSSVSMHSMPTPKSATAPADVKSPCLDDRAVKGIPAARDKRGGVAVVHKPAVSLLQRGCWKLLQFMATTFGTLPAAGLRPTYEKNSCHTVTNLSPARFPHPAMDQHASTLKGARLTSPSTHLACTPACHPP